MDFDKSVGAFEIKNDDAEIDLQFQDFGGSTGDVERDHEAKGTTIYFDSFPDSAIDDQEQKLLDDEDDEGKRKSSHSFWTFEYYQQFFDVESRQVGDRIIWSMVPKPGVNFLQSYIRPNPDLYGPFWICITLVLTTGVAGNLSSYLQSSKQHTWRYDFHKVSLAISSIFAYAWLVPLLIFGVLYWRRSKANISLLELICLYGYSLAVFVPVSLLWIIPLRWLQWCLGIVASVLSGSVLVRTIQPAISHEAKKIALGLAVLILVLHAALALGFMLYFFYPSTTATPAVVENPQNAKSNGSLSLPKAAEGKAQNESKEQVNKKEEESKKQSAGREEKSITKVRATNDEKGNKEKEDFNKVEKVTSVVHQNGVRNQTESIDKSSSQRENNLQDEKIKIVTTSTSKKVSSDKPKEQILLDSTKLTADKTISLRPLSQKLLVPVVT